MTADLHVAVPPARWSVVDRARPLDRGPHPGGREVGGQASGRRNGARSWKEQRAPGRGRARGGPHASPTPPRTRSTPGCCAAGASPGPAHRDAVLEAHRAAARRPTAGARAPAAAGDAEGASRRARGGSRPWRSRTARLRDAGAHPQARQALGHREGARLEQAPNTASCRACRSWSLQISAWRRARGARWWRRFSSSRLEQRVAVPGSTISATAVRPRRVAVPDHAEAEEGRAPRPGAGPRAARRSPRQR